MKLSRMIPMLGVADVGQTVAFYGDALGFEVVERHEWEGTLCWVHMRSGDTELMFTRVESGDSDEALRPGRKKLYFYFYPEDVAALHASLQRKGYEVSDLRVTFYEMKEFELEDADGYQLWFGQHTDEPQTECD